MSDGGTMPADAPDANKHEIPISKTAEYAYRVVFTDLKRVYLLAWKPALAAVAVGLALAFGDNFLHRGPVLSDTLGALVGYWSNAYFALAFHRYQLFGWNENTSHVKFGFGPAERFFLLIATGMYILYNLVPALLEQTGIDAPGVGFVIETVSIFIGVGISLSFPAAAAEHPAPLGYGWSLTRGIRWRIFWIEVTCLAPPALLIVFLAMVVPMDKIAPLQKIMPVAAPVVVGLLSYPFTATIIASLCRIFKIRSAAAQFQTPR